jgi:hypothetical protein
MAILNRNIFQYKILARAAERRNDGETGHPLLPVFGRHDELSGPIDRRT